MAEGGTVFDDLENNLPEHGEGDGEEDGEKDGEEDGDLLEGPYETAWIDDDLDYNDMDISVVKKFGTKDSITTFINKMITRKGTISREMSEENRKNTVKLIRSFLALTDGGNIRPLLSNEDGLRIIRGSTFSRGGSVRFGGLKTILSYNGVDVREINTSKSTIYKSITGKLTEGLPAEVEFSRLVTSVFKITDDMVESVSDETGVSREVVREVFDEDEYPELTPEMIESMYVQGKE